jgi:GntR family transcriptional regulator
MSGVPVLLAHNEHSMLPFQIKIVDGVPPSDQLVLAVRRAILTGFLLDGQEFPSVRTISQELQLSPTTVHKAIGQLRESGLLASRPGVGMVVRTDAMPSNSDRLLLLKPALDALVREAVALHLPPEEVAKAVEKAISKARKI